MFKIIAQDKNIIPYRKELNKISGGALESIFLVQILYWFEQSGGEFYKFREPCEHELYKEGDSWTEELGFSVKTIDRMIKKFKEKGFISTRKTINRLTFYRVNVEVINECLSSIYEIKNIKAKKEKNHISQTSEDETVKLASSSSQTSNYGTDKLASRIKNNNYSSRDYSEITSEITSETTSENLTPTPFKNLNLEAFNKWVKYCEQKGFKIVGIQFDELKKHLCKFSKERQDEIISYSIANGYKGLYEPKAEQTKLKVVVDGREMIIPDFWDEDLKQAVINGEKSYLFAGNEFNARRFLRRSECDDAMQNAHNQTQTAQFSTNYIEVIPNHTEEQKSDLNANKSDFLETEFF